ncbi:MAG: hypothetical protein ABI682_00595 [Acidobacteriota bacterium]
MKLLRSFGLIALLALTLLPAALRAAEKPNPGWERMKSLVGEWDGVYQGKAPVHVSYKIVSKGTTLMEIMSSSEEPDMVSMYTPDGGRLLMTHYCSEANQPRLRAEATPAEPKKISFGFVDASGLATPAAGHMHHLEVVFKDPDHFSQEWTHRADGKDMTSTFDYTRRR